jgi:hypothetical protein
MHVSCLCFLLLLAAVLQVPWMACSRCAHMRKQMWLVPGTPANFGVAAASCHHAGAADGSLNV